MTHHVRTGAFLALTAALMTVAACKKAENADSSSMNPPAMAPTPVPPAAVTAQTIFTGRRLGDNKQISDSTSRFNARDTMYVVVTTANTPSGGNMMAKWTYETGAVVDSIIQSVEKTDSVQTTSITEFHIMKPTPWPNGKYTIDISMDGRSLGTRTVEVGKK